MNVEENRLQTFNTWPTDAAITSARAAKAGFFYTNRDLIVECFACHVQIGEWNYGDQVMAKHKLLSPQCPFVLEPSTSGNVPNISQPVGLSTTAPTNSYSLKDENVRLQTFANWPKPEVVTPESLARAGFYSLKESDFTKCAFCDVVLVAWEPGDDPDKEHQRCSPSCYFVQWVINTRLGENTGKTAALSNLELVSGDNLEELGVQQHKTPKNPKYATYESRHSTFTKWPTELTQKPDELATAGFYFEGAGDKVRCFHCDGGLNHWEPLDDPWSQHARWFPYCAYVQLVKGKEFVKTCATSNFEDHASCRKREASAQRKEISESEVEAQLTSEPALAALNIGLHVGRVKQAIKEKLEQTGVGFSTSDALIEATLNIQAEEEDDGDARLSDNVSSMLRTVLHEALCEEDRAKNSVDLVDRKIAAEATFRNNLTLEEENRLLKEARLCKICMDSEVGIVFLPCGHLATCVKCAPNLKDCPVCRSSIKATVRTFLS